MGLKLLFTHSFFLRLDSKQWKTKKPFPPLGTLYAMALLRQQGHRVKLHDTMFEDGPAGLEQALTETAPDALVIYDDSFNYLTKMCLSRMQDAAFEMIGMAKARGCRIVVCGSDATDHRERYLECGADAVIVGEGEQSLAEVVRSWADGEYDLSGVNGLALMADGHLKQTPPRATMRELDHLPRPAWDLIDLKPYENMWRAAHGSWSLNLVSSRGCPYSCSWCAKPIWGSQYVVHSPERMVSDLAYLRRHHDFDHIWFCDDIFGLNPEWTRRFADSVEAEGLELEFTIQARVDSLLRSDVASDLARAGLHTAWLGAESGSQKIVDAMNKEVSIEQIYDAVQRLKSVGVRVALFLQFGYLGESREDIDKTIQMVIDLLPDEIGISVSYPLPGTPFHEQVSAQLKTKSNWTESDELALMYRSTFQPAYYQRLHRYVHKRFQKHRGYASLKSLIKRPWRVDRRHLRSALATAYYLPASIIDGFRLRRLEQQ